MINEAESSISTVELTEQDVDKWFESESENVVQLEEENITDKFVRAQLRVVRSSMDLTLHNLKSSLADPNYIKVNPIYQRRQRWDLQKKSQLIESLLLNIPVPPVFLFENEYNQYEIMDGRQRLETIGDFLNNKFALRSLEYWPELKGKTFEQLPTVIQRGLLRRTISAMVLLAETTRPEDSEFDVRLALFKRLNTGGINLNPQEIRNALYPSKFNALIIELSRGQIFRSIWGIPQYVVNEETSPSKEILENTLYKTMADCDLVLRFFAIRETIICGRKGSLQSLMNTCMARHMKDSEAEISEYRNDFCRVLESLYGIFQGKPFVLPQNNRVSRPIYDAFMVGAYIVGPTEITSRGASIREHYYSIIEDEDSYEILVGRGNTIESIINRVDLAIEILTK